MSRLLLLGVGPGGGGGAVSVEGDGTAAGVGTAAAVGLNANADPYFSSVVFLAGFEGADAAATYSEEKNARAATFFGNAQLDTAQSKFGSSSLLLDGTGDYITFADNNDWDLSDANSDQFTVECWVRLNALATDRIFVAHYSSTGNFGWGFQETNPSDEFTFAASTNGTTFGILVTTAAANLTTNTWYAVAADKDSSGKIRVYLNGTMVASSTPANSAFYNPSTTLSIGATGNGSGTLNGWIDELRITKGVARYASDGGYTVTTTAFPRS